MCPPERTAEAVDLLREHPGTAHLIVHRGVAVTPEGDLVEADVAREAADEIVDALCGLGLDHSGGITMEALDTALSDAADAAEESAPGEAADAVVWQELLGRTGEESRWNATFQAFLVIACLLAAVGVLTDSPVTVVGAMVVGPEFGPLAAIAMGLVLRRWDLVRRAGLALVAGFPVAMACTLAGVLLGTAAGIFEPDVIVRNHEVDFVYQVGPASFVVALLAGAAGMLAMTSAKSAALVGVFISVTTVPAAGYVVVAAVAGRWDRAGFSLLQLLVNLAGIVLAAAIVLILRRRKQRSGVLLRPLSRG
ncbi:putative hydrophobic protein (TIGR00271 family) [Amycolatopsis jiangsuensis]|uniref:Putative hydrophobic protein (TIGR00271 family) n=1 Tax=Amycolatopsis jiangsuensis TaxID=1181879 RepID=A0A840IQM2_9PSEU|nr:putative hydrophobic protein (TIGR00271 family) [Amycolatopsis jiangsuensis]